MKHIKGGIMTKNPARIRMLNKEILALIRELEKAMGSDTELVEEYLVINKKIKEAYKKTY